MENPDLLILIIDVNPLAWGSGSKAAEHDFSLQQALEQIVIFANAHLALSDENQLVVYACSALSSSLLYSSKADYDPSPQAATDSNAYSQFRVLDERLFEGVRHMLTDTQEHTFNNKGLVGALTMSLCHINKIQQADTKVKPSPRILIMSATTDSSSQYIQVMNCIFSAQKSSIPVDVCKILGDDTVFLQQASHLTSGAYLKLDHPSGLLQYLMTSFLPGRATRKHINLPVQEQVDLRAACFCHRKIIDIGFVCSVCLSIFCSARSTCSTCKSPFAVGNGTKEFGNTNGS